MPSSRSTHQSTFLGGLQLFSDFLCRQWLGGGILLDCFGNLHLIDVRLGENHLVTQSTLAFLLAANFGCYFEGRDEFQLKSDSFLVSPVDQHRFCLENSAACIGADSCMSHPLRCTSEASQWNDVFYMCNEGGEAKDEAIAYTARMKMNKKSFAWQSARQMSSPSVSSRNPKQCTLLLQTGLRFGTKLGKHLEGFDRK